MARDGNSRRRSAWNERDISNNHARERGHQIHPISRLPSEPIPRPTRPRQAQLVNNSESSPAEDNTTNPTPNQARNATPFLSTVDILGKFKLPETQPVFKVEPSEPDIMKLPLRSSRRQKDDKPSIYAIKPRKRVTGTVPQDASERERKDLNQGRGNQNTRQQNTVVDLTAGDNDEEEEEEEERAPHPGQNNGLKTQRQDRIPQIGPFAPSNTVTDDKIPDMALQYIREQYRHDQIALPTNITNWQQLLEFSSANIKPTLITPTLVVQWRTDSLFNSVPQPKFGLFSPQSSAFVQSTIPNTSSRNLFLNQNTSSFPFPQAIATTKDTNRASLNSERTIETINKPEHRVLLSPNTTTIDRPLSSLSDNQTGTLVRSCPQTTSLSQEVSNTNRHHGFDSASNHRQQTANTSDIDILMQPSQALADLLPPSTPSGHPHLVSLWHPYLLRLPNTQHDHLDLIDTIISIMSKYDMKEQSVIKAFLDMNEVPHFFFLFKSRTNAWHSWSIERELNIVTIGLERNNRAANTTESTRPSSGQFDVTIQYKMDPPTLKASILSDNSTADTVSGTNPTVTITEKSPSAQDVIDPSTTQNALSSAPSSPPAQVAPTVPGLWHLHGTTLFPSQPSLHTFLWTTPPNRGADEVSRYYHPTQSHILPLSHLSILARYLQHTAFTCTLMQAEFQVVWGRKVRFDSVLGRVRATYDHALKGAKTQAEKRKRGDYNRPIGKSGLNNVKNADVDDGEKEAGGSRPGAGDAMDFLSGKTVVTTESENNTDAELTGQETTSITADLVAARAGPGRVDRSLSERLRDVIPRTANPSGSTANARGRNELNNTTTLSYHPTTIKAERPRKRLKREGRDETSGSEYSDSGSDEE